MTAFPPNYLKFCQTFLSYQVSENVRYSAIQTPFRAAWTFVPPSPQPQHGPTLFGYTWVSFGFEAASWRLSRGFEISLLFCSGRLRRRRSNAAWCLGGESHAFGVAGSAAWAGSTVRSRDGGSHQILTVCYCGAAVLICVISVNLTASVVADRLAARGRSRRDAG